ncbi:MAG: hypothetical protein LBT56_08625 [Prevotellaceae bacterium]|jgi:hypothetical protein|nr:hypothetical protein [Prevotellaceae bacterium]
MKNDNYKFVIAIILVIYTAVTITSCGSPRVNVKIIKHEPPIATDSTVIIYRRARYIPNEAEQLGIIKINCTELFSKNCDSASVFSIAKTEAQKAGGNALLITKYKKLSFLNSNLKLNADIIKVSDFESPLNNSYRDKRYVLHDIHEKGTLNLRFSLPYINIFNFKFDKDRVHDAGFIGALFGIDYYHKNNQYISLFAGAGINFLAPAPAPVDYGDGEYDFLYSGYFGLTNNYHYENFIFGYGLSYSRNIWHHRNYGDYYDVEDIMPNKDYYDKSLGFVFSFHYSLRNFSAGLIYRPDIIRLNSSVKFMYKHLISIDFAWKIRLKTVGKK